MPRRIPTHTLRDPSPPPPRKRSRDTNKDYDHAWRKLRAQFLVEHPLCMCDDCKEGEMKLTHANVVDHIQTIADHPELRLVWTNLRSMNKICHDRHTRITENRKIKARRDRDEDSFMSRVAALYDVNHVPGRVMTLGRSFL